MIGNKLREVLTTPPDAALAIITRRADGPHVVNSWNSYVQITDEGELLIPAGRMFETEKNIASNNKVKLTITNREVEGKTYKGTGFLVEGTAVMEKEGPRFDIIKSVFPWARAALTIKVESEEQTL